jgi:hypothetical protein
VSEIPYRLATPHTTLRYCFTASCAIDLTFVQPWESYTRVQQQEFFDHGEVPCLGSFRPGLWCEGCRFGHVSLIEAEDAP